MNLRGLDLNLLPVFEAVYDEGGITRASERLSLTQPAVSNALARLRAALSDPLFVRAARGMAPTPKAQALIAPVREALSRLRSGLDQPARFDSRTSERVFNVAAGDTAASALLPALIPVLEREAPLVRFHWRQLDRPSIPEDFAAGRLDFAMDVPVLARPELASTALSSEPYVCCLRKSHPRATGRFTLAHFLALRHIAVSSRLAGKSLVDIALGKLGERVRPVVRLPHHQPGFHAVMASDLALVAPLSLARRYDVAIRDLPFDAPTVDLMLFWRRDAAGDAGLAWARDKLVAAALQREAAAPGERGGRRRPVREKSGSRGSVRA